METPKPYISIHCWKCKAQNNAAVAIHCRVCGAYLSAAEENENPLSHGVSDHPAFKGYLLIVGVVLLLSAGLIYFYKSKPRGALAASTGSKEVELPSNSWYNDSWWSYVSSSPSLKQILKKNEEANGKTPSLDTAITLSFSGKVSRAIGSCFEQFCVDEAERRMAEQEKRVPPEFRRFYSSAIRVGPKPIPETSDKYDKLNFSEFGQLELLVKMPDRMVRKATAINPYDDSQRRVEVIEFLNGVEGKRITDFFDVFDKKVKSDVDTMDAQQVKSARVEQASLLGKDFGDYTDMELRRLEKVNERVAFVVSAKNQNGEPETFYFDAVTGFLIKIDTPLNAFFLDDYRPWRLGMLPYTVYVRQPELGGFHTWMKIEIAEWKIGEPIDDSLFEIPAGN